MILGEMHVDQFGCIKSLHRVGSQQTLNASKLVDPAVPEGTVSVPLPNRLSIDSWVDLNNDLDLLRSLSLY